VPVARLACCSSRQFVCAGCIEPACLPVRQSSCGGYAGRTAAAHSQRLFWAVVPCRLAVYSVRIHVDGAVSVRTARQAPGNCLCSLQKGSEGAGPASAPQCCVLYYLGDSMHKVYVKLRTQRKALIVLLLRVRPMAKPTPQKGSLPCYFLGSGGSCQSLLVRTQEPAGDAVTEWHAAGVGSCACLHICRFSREWHSL